MNNTKIIQTIEKIDTFMKDPKHLDVYINFYKEILTNAKNLKIINNIDKLYCHFNQNTNKISIETKASSSNNIFFIRMDTDLIKLLQKDDDCYIAARDFLAMPAYKKSDRLEALTFIAEKGLESFKTINRQIPKFTDSHILDYVYDHKLSFSILDLEEKVEVTARWLEQVQPNIPKEFFENLDSFDDVKEKLLKFEVNKSSLYSDILRPILLLERMMEKNLISKSLYLTKFSEFCELNKNSLTKDDIETLLIWTCNNSIFKNPQMSSYSPSYYAKEQLNTIPKDVLSTFSKTIDNLKQLSPNDENIANKILKPIDEVLEKQRRLIMRPNYFFNNPDDLVNHLLIKLPEEPGILRLNLTLYFLFATYAAAYNPKVENPNISDEQPRFVADLTFTADKYGPQDYSVNDKLRNEYYQPKEYNFLDNQVDQNLKHFIDDILKQLKDVDDFSLLDRAVQDDAWLNAYTNSDSKLISKEQMTLDYQH